jgi:hypothetical protein
MSEEGRWPSGERHAEEAAHHIPNGSVPPVADSCLELFGHGWTPNPGPLPDADGYTGRHRAHDGDGGDSRAAR